MASSRKRKIVVTLFCLGVLFFIVIFAAGVVALISSSKSPYKNTKGQSIAILKIEGVISESEKTLKTIRDIRDNENIKAIILRINSPGGLVAPSQEIFQEVKRLKEEKKKFVVASMETVAASGGYYVACAADSIVANPGTLTASIGVKMDFANLEKLYEWLKVKPYTLTSGRFKDIGSPNREMTPDEKQLILDMIQNIYEQFTSVVLESRKTKIKKEELEKIADGRVMTGHQALQYGLVDRLGSFEDAVDEAKKLAGITGEPNIIYPPKERITVLRQLMEEKVLEKIVSLFLMDKQPLPEWQF